MTDYTKSTNFATKDSLSSGNALKIVKGTEIDTEFNSIQTAIATKADLTSPTFTGTVVIPTATITTGNITTGNITSAAISGGTITSTTLSSPTITNYVETVVAIGTVSTSSTLSLTNGTVQTATLTASTTCTFTMPTATAGKSFVLLLKQAASTGNGAATFTNVKWGISGTPTITTTAGKMDILSFISDGTNWYGSVSQGYTP